VGEGIAVLVSKVYLKILVSKSNWSESGVPAVACGYGLVKTLHIEYKNNTLLKLFVKTNDLCIVLCALLDSINIRFPCVLIPENEA